MFATFVVLGAVPVMLLTGMFIGGAALGLLGEIKDGIGRIFR